MHRHNVMQKFQVQSLAELAVAAERLGLLLVSDRRGGEGAEQAEKRNKQPLTLLSIGMPSRQAWPTHVGDAACSSQFFTDDSIACARIHGRCRAGFRSI